MYSQPVFATIEDLLLACAPRIESIPEWITRGVYRTAYVLVITVIAVILPFFSAFVGLIGAITFWPLAVFYPIQMYRKVYSPQGLKVWFMLAVMGVMALVAVLATVSSLETIVQSASSFKVFN